MTIEIPDNEPAVHEEMFNWTQDLFPICRSITGDGVRETTAYLRKILPSLQVHEVPTGTECFDWKIPDEWTIRDAYIADTSGSRIVDFKKNNLSVVNYSISVNQTMTLDELEPHLHSLPEQPDAIPYVSSYYKPRWGFCLPDRQRRSLGPGPYKVKIDSHLGPGSLTYSDLILHGSEKTEILLSAYTCHPSMANDNLSGISVLMAIARWLTTQQNRRYTYRIIFAPETIGSIVYLSRHLEVMREKTIAGYIFSCMGDDQSYSFQETRWGNTLVDRISRHVLRHHTSQFQTSTYLERGSDERQYSSPGVDIPIAVITRSKFDLFPEYHTSLDDLSFISSSGLGGSFEIMRKCIAAFENNYYFRTTHPCEPQLGKRGLYPDLNTKTLPHSVRDIVNFLAYADGTIDLIALSEQIQLPFEQCAIFVKSLLSEKLIESSINPWPSKRQG